MKELELKMPETCGTKCGEMFLTINGAITLLCTLCDGTYKYFQDYADHLMSEHCGNIVLEEYYLPNEPQHESENCFDKSKNDEDSNSISLSQDTHIKGAFTENITVENLFQKNKLPGSKGKESTSLQVDENADVAHIHPTNSKMKTDDNVDNIGSKHQPHLHSPEKRRFKCTECDFACKDKSNLMGHIKRHSNRKPFKCSECNKEFYTRTELKSHFRRHTGERPFLCTDCGLTFFTSGILSAHVKRHKNIRDKECKFCHKGFYDAATLAAHLRTHTGERPFKCKLCESSFKRGNALFSHMKMHENNREYQCEFCAARFNQKCNLNAHRKNKHLLAISTKSEKT